MNTPAPSAPIPPRVGTVLLLALIAAAAAPEEGGPRLLAVRTSGPVHLDGRLDEPCWRLAPVASGFRQRDPREGEPASEDTQVRVVYDKDTLYVGILALDREPDQLIARLLERDRLLTQDAGNVARFAGDDVVAFTLDPFHDHRDAFLFAVNPNGAEADALVTDESQTLNLDWRGIWRVATARTRNGWSAEFAIPFRSLRYADTGREQVWGFDVERIVRRRNEDTLWSAWSRAEGGLNRVSRAGHLEGLSGLPRSAFNIEVKPYGLGGATWQPDLAGQAPASGEWRAGGDAKWEVQPGLVLDATVRPDFSQVEADDQVVNLTRFELFFPEKRDFFLENAGIFDLGTRGSYETPPFLLFFSRRIGIQGEDEVPVLAGVRLSGRAGRQTIGLMDVYTGELSGPGATVEEPRTNFGVMRWKRDVGERGYVGAMLTDRRTSAGAATDGGVDASLWPASRLNLQGFMVRTADGSGADWAARASAEYSADPVYLFAEYLRIGPQAQTGMGFVTRTDLRRASWKAQYTFRPRIPGLRQIAAYVGGKVQARTNGESQDGNGFAGASVLLDSGDVLTATHVRGYTVLDGGFRLSDRIPIAPGRSDLTDTEVSLSSSPKRALSASASASLLGLWNGSERSWTLGGSAQGAHLSLGLSYTRSEASFPAGGFVANVAGLRLGWAFSTRLSAQTFLQHDDLDRRFVGNFRLRFIYRPGSDLYFVYDEERGEPGDPQALISRGAVLKLSYVARF